MNDETIKDLIAEIVRQVKAGCEAAGVQPPHEIHMELKLSGDCGVIKISVPIQAPPSREGA